MEKLRFTITIDAPRENVWEMLWNDEQYREWTSVFSEGSTAETDWKEGSSIKFLDGSGNGIISTIDTKRPPEKMIFKHLGEIKNGVEVDAKLTEWAGAIESYTLQAVRGKTELIVETEVTDDFKDYFQKTWPVALEKIKSMAEEQVRKTVTTPQ